MSPEISSTILLSLGSVEVVGGGDVWEVEGVASVVNHRELPDRSAELSSRKVAEMRGKTVVSHSRSFRIIRVCWLTGRSLRVKQSVRWRKGDSENLEVFSTRGGGNEETHFNLRRTWIDGLSRRRREDVRESARGGCLVSDRVPLLKLLNHGLASSQPSLQGFYQTGSCQELFKSSRLQRMKPFATLVTLSGSPVYPTHN